MAGPEEQLQRAFDSILAEARANVAARRDPNASGLEARIALAARRARDEGIDVSTAQAAALDQLARIASVHRARALVTRETAAPPPEPEPRRPAAVLRAKPTITGSLDVRRGDREYELVWNPAPAVSEWEVRFSERADQRSDYVEREVVVLAAGETRIAVPLGDKPFRVNIIGRGRGRLQRRALISGLTRESWRERWQRRASAS